jgi:hypothetical protein
MRRKKRNYMVCQYCCIESVVWVSFRTRHTNRHGNSNGAFPPGFDTGKKGAMPEPGVGMISKGKVIIRQDLIYLCHDTGRISPY